MCESLKKVKENLRKLEPVFHYPAKYLRLRSEVSNLMAQEFWEVGASGKVYKKDDVIETLFNRYEDQNPAQEWQISEFEVVQLARNVYLATYLLLQGKYRYTRRVTVWRNDDSCWKAVYHQGTLTPRPSDFKCFT
jgi:hypothetical protein